HLLHWALQQVLGEHVRQGGSIVEPTRLRFDFSHHKALSFEEIRQIERAINAKIRENCPVHTYELPYTEVQKQQEIKQFFGEKYGASVRVVDIEYSKELCGGTHTIATGTIGYFRIVKEGSISAGMRRIEAVTGEEAEAFTQEREAQGELRAQTLEVEKKELIKRITHLQRELLTVEVENLLEHIIKIDSIPFLAQAISLDPKELRECADLIMDKQTTLILFLIAKGQKPCSFLVRVSADLVRKKIRADELVKEMTSLVGGKGGGRAEGAQGSGIEPENIPAALKFAHQWIEQKII
ncbi:MAG: DHHA1 domain-containing protein, partial [Chlamydiales bacterium]